MGLMGIRVEGRRGRIILATDYADYADSDLCRCAGFIWFGYANGAVGLVGWGNEF